MVGLAAFTDLEDLGSAVRANTLGRRPAVLHRDLLRLLDLDFFLLFDTVTLWHWPHLAWCTGRRREAILGALTALVTKRT